MDRSHSNEANHSNGSSSTEDYDHVEYDEAAAIVINEEPEEDEADCILIPPVVETIDLCTQAFQAPRRLRPLALVNEVIEVLDSPARDRGGQMLELQVIPIPFPDGTRTQNSPARNRRHRQSSSPPYVVPPNRPNLDDSMDKVKISCPVCLESAFGREPVSTICGHIFCKACLQESLQVAKKCPMCKKTLSGRSPFHNIYF